jgi:hypothetical protein
MRGLLGVTLAMALAGCAGQASQPVYTATGAVGHSIDCSGLAKTWNACLAQAGELCRAKGYNVVSQTGERETALVVTEERSLADYIGPGKVARSMVVTCKA